MSPAPGESSISKAEAEATYEALSEKLGATKRTLQGIGVRVPAGSRLDAYARALQRLSQTVDWEQIDPAERQLIHDAILECEQLLPSISTLAQEPEVDGWRSVAMKAIGGQASSRTEGSSTPGRDAQSELFVASLARRGGYEVRFAEPDLILSFPGEESLGVAVKRVKSHRSFSKRLREASGQIRGAKVQGIAAINLGFFALPIRAEHMASASESLRAEIQAYAKRRLPELIKLIDRRWCFGLLLFATKPAFLTVPTQLAVVLAVYMCNLCGETDPRCLVLDKISERLPATIWQL